MKQEAEASHILNLEFVAAYKEELTWETKNRVSLKKPRCFCGAYRGILALRVVQRRHKIAPKSGYTLSQLFL
jgi:hypothetical protein